MSFRDQFHIPIDETGEELVYFSGNSLGLQPKAVSNSIQAELDYWARNAVEGHFSNDFPWVSYHQRFSSLMAPIVGAKTSEVIVMNSLTVNLHLLMASFYRPRGKRTKVLVEKDIFPSDLFAVQSQLDWQGFNASEDLIELEPNENGIYEEDSIVHQIKENQDSVALVLLGGVNYLTGQKLPMKAIAETCQALEIPFGLDLAHAVGNVALELNDWGVDFAVWCSYKYLNGGPGAVGGAFVHEKHHLSGLPKLKGWWGTEEKSRFRMEKEFKSSKTVESWQLSNAPILSMAALLPSLELFNQIGMKGLIDLREHLLIELLGRLGDHKKLKVITPLNDEHRGAQVSIYLSNKDDKLIEGLRNAGFVTDWRYYKDGGMIRLAPVGFYNTLKDVYYFCDELERRI